MKSLVIVADMAQAVEGPRQGEWTYADWEELGRDDDNRYEIIDGVLYMTTAPKDFHQWIISRSIMIWLVFPRKITDLPIRLLRPSGC